jgi:hypothetical protein
MLNKKLLTERQSYYQERRWMAFLELLILRPRKKVSKGTRKCMFTSEVLRVSSKIFSRTGKLALSSLQLCFRAEGQAAPIQ